METTAIAVVIVNLATGIELIILNQISTKSIKEEVVKYSRVTELPRVRIQLRFAL